MLDTLKVKGVAELTLLDSEGQAKQSVTTSNLVVDTGLNFIVDRMKDDETVMTHMGVGTGTTAPAAGNTTLETQLGGRELIETSTVTDNSILYRAVFEAGDSTGQLTEAAIFNASTGGTMLCRVTFTAIDKQANDSLAIKWTISLSAS